MKRKYSGYGIFALLIGVILISGCTATGNVVKNTGNDDGVCTEDGCAIENIVSSEDVVSIPLNDVTTSVKHYSYTSGGATINYFAVLDSAGNVKVAFDACEVCGGSKGYRQEGTDVICNNCGRHFKIDELGEKNVYGGGCWPAHLEHKIENGNIVIQKSDIEKGRRFFV